MLSPTRSMVATALLLSIFGLQAVAVKGYAALGDSYASGDGAGSSKLFPNFDITCGRFDQAYPVQVFNSSRLEIPRSGFKNLACGGTSSLSVLKTQVPKIGNSEVISITVGGNEVDFFVLMNACVHEWYPHLPCKQEMTQARSLVQSRAFLNNFNKMVAGTMKAMQPNSKLLVTGYAMFFNDTTDQCDHASFSRRNPRNFLSKELRRNFNQMVTMVNDVIRAAAEAQGATYVDVDKLFQKHRFCEEGIIEPGTHNETWFFNMKYEKEQEQDDVQQFLPNPIKDFFDLTRTFHPTARGHKEIADEIIRLVE